MDNTGSCKSIDRLRRFVRTTKPQTPTQNIWRLGGELGMDSYPSLCINCGHGLVLISAPTGGFHRFHDSLGPVRSAVGVHPTISLSQLLPQSVSAKRRSARGNLSSTDLFGVSRKHLFIFGHGSISALDCSTRIISFRSSDTTAHRRRSQLKHFKAPVIIPIVVNSNDVRVWQHVARPGWIGLMDFSSSLDCSGFLAHLRQSIVTRTTQTHYRP